MDFFSPYFGWDQSSKWVGLLGYCLGGRCYVAWRHHWELTFVGDAQKNLARLPPSLTAYLGDVPTLRGFRQTRLPNPGLTVLSEGLEVRFNGVPYAPFESYVFTDAGKLGYLPFFIGPRKLICHRD